MYIIWDIWELVRGEKYLRCWCSCKPHENFSQMIKSWFMLLKAAFFCKQYHNFTYFTTKAMKNHYLCVPIQRPCSQWIYMYLQTMPYYCIIDTEFLWFPLNHIPEFNKNKNYSELLSLLFYLSQGSLHQVSPKFLEQTLDKKLMSNMRVRWWIPWYWPHWFSVISMLVKKPL